MAGKGNFEDQNKSVYDSGHKPERGQKMVQDIFAGHEGEKKAYKDQHKEGSKDKVKLEESAEAAATRKDLSSLNGKFKPYLPEGSQIVGHGHGKSGEYIFVKPSKDSKDIYAINPDTGKPEAHYRVVDHKWAQVKPEANGGETLKFPDKSSITMDKAHHVTSVRDAHGKETYHSDGKNCTYTDKQGHTWKSEDGGKSFHGPKNEKGEVKVSADGTVTLIDSTNKTKTVDKRDGSETTTNDKGMLTHVKDANGKDVSIHYGADGKTPDAVKEKDGSVWNTKDGQTWTSDTGKPSPWQGTLRTDSAGNIVWTAKDGHVTKEKPDGGTVITQADKSEIDYDAKGNVTHVRDAKGRSSDIHYAPNGNPDRYKDANGDLWTSKDGHSWSNQDGKSWKGKVQAHRDGTVTTTGNDKVVHYYKSDGTETWGAS